MKYLQPDLAILTGFIHCIKSSFHSVSRVTLNVRVFAGNEEK